MPRYWVLDDAGEPVPSDLMTWARWLEQFDRRRVVFDRVGNVEVSTVFLGLDHSFSQSGPPILWETLVFGGAHDGQMKRYPTRAAALAGHASVLAAVRLSENVHG